MDISHKSSYDVPTGGVPRSHSNGSASDEPADQHPVPNAPIPLLSDQAKELIKQATIGEIKKHSHYYKDVSNLAQIDVYRVLELFNVNNPSIAHAVKKLLVAGGRGAGKDINKDIQEAIDSLVRWQEMRKEDDV